MPTRQQAVMSSSGGKSKKSGARSAAGPKSREARQSVRRPVEAMRVTAAISSARVSSVRGTAAPEALTTASQRLSTISAAPWMAN